LVNYGEMMEENIAEVIKELSSGEW
jgi:hypothetical protein